VPQLSVVIITFNEEKNIARCLESVKEIADEIVVLDSFSKDSTKGNLRLVWRSIL
jgi:glycosyltransferase involved in cell wall biosynthesis